MSLSPERAAHVACTHCGLDVPVELRVAEADEQFCCSACRTVYAAIHTLGLEAFYKLQADEERQQAVVSGRSYGPFDDPAFHARHVDEAPDGTRHIRLYLEGVHCGACVWLVERLPQVLEGVQSARLDLRRQVLDVAWRPERVALSRIGATLDGLGYPAHPWAEDRRESLRRREQRTQLIRIGVAGACAGNAMLIAFALYGGALSGMDPRYESFFRYCSAGLTFVALFWPGRVFLRGALSSLRTGVMHMDLPVAIALLAGSAWGLANTIRGVGEVYFESMTAVIFLLLVGRWVQSRQQRAAQDAVSLLFSLTPATALRLTAEGADEEISVESLALGDRVRVRAGDEIPVDGVISEGASDLDLSLLTGESEPVAARAGDAVHAGTQNLSAAIVVETRATGAETRAGRLMQQVERFARERPPLVRLADRVAHVFVIVVLALAFVTAAAWWRVGPDVAIERAITLLIVTCPCALGLATPLALLAAIGRAAERGILIKGGEVLERLARPGRLWIDKTGTLTLGALRLAEWRGEASLGALIVALERGVRHPVAQALVEHFGESSAEASEVRAESGRGVSGIVDGRRVQIGHPAWVGARAEVPAWVASLTHELEERALSPLWVAVDGRVRGVAGLGDTLRPEAPAAIERLRALGWETSILSGDRRAVVDPIARRLGLGVERAQAEATPEEKVDQVRRSGSARERRPIFGRDRPIVMVGDGVNDAAALAAADVGVAVQGGAPASLGAADVFLRREGLSPLVELIAGSRRVVGVIRRNVAISLGYNLVAGTLAIAGIIDPMIAAILMPFSSLTVVACSYRSRTFGAER